MQATQEVANGIAGIFHVIQDIVIRWVETFRQFPCTADFEEI